MNNQMNNQMNKQQSLCNAIATYLTGDDKMPPSRLGKNRYKFDKDNNKILLNKDQWKAYLTRQCQTILFGDNVWKIEGNERVDVPKEGGKQYLCQLLQQSYPFVYEALYLKNTISKTSIGFMILVSCVKDIVTQHLDTKVCGYMDYSHKPVHDSFVKTITKHLNNSITNLSSFIVRSESKFINYLLEFNDQNKKPVQESMVDINDNFFKKAELNLLNIDMYRYVINYMDPQLYEVKATDQDRSKFVCSDILVVTSQELQNLKAEQKEKTKIFIINIATDPDAPEWVCVQQVNQNQNNKYWIVYYPKVEGSQEVIVQQKIEAIFKNIRLQYAPIALPKNKGSETVWQQWQYVLLGRVLPAIKANQDVDSYLTTAPLARLREYTIQHVVAPKYQYFPQNVYSLMRYHQYEAELVQLPQLETYIGQEQKQLINLNNSPINKYYKDLIPLVNNDSLITSLSENLIRFEENNGQKNNVQGGNKNTVSVYINVAIDGSDNFRRRVFSAFYQNNIHTINFAGFADNENKNHDAKQVAQEKAVFLSLVNVDLALREVVLPVKFDQKNNQHGNYIILRFLSVIAARNRVLCHDSQDFGETSYNMLFNTLKGSNSIDEYENIRKVHGNWLWKRALTFSLNFVMKLSSNISSDNNFFNRYCNQSDQNDRGIKLFSDIVKMGADWVDFLFYNYKKKYNNNNPLPLFFDLQPCPAQYDLTSVILRKYQCLKREGCFVSQQLWLRLPKSPSRTELVKLYCQFNESKRSKGNEQKEKIIYLYVDRVDSKDLVLFLQALLSCIKTSRACTTQIVIPSFDKKDFNNKQSPEYLLYKSIQNMVLVNNRFSQQDLLKKNVMPMIQFKFPDGYKHYEFKEEKAEDRLWPLQVNAGVGVVQQQQLQQQQQQQQQQQRQQQRQKQWQQQVEVECKKDEISEYNGDENALYSRKNIANHRSLPNAVENFNRWVGSTCEANGLISYIEPQAVEKIIEFMDHFSMGVNFDYLPSGFSLQSTKSGKLVLCYQHPLVEKEVHPYRVLLPTPMKTVKIKRGDSRQLINSLSILQPQGKEDPRDCYMSTEMKEAKTGKQQFWQSIIGNDHGNLGVASSISVLKKWLASFESSDKKIVFQSEFITCFFNNNKMHSKFLPAFGELFYHYDFCNRFKNRGGSSNDPVFYRAPVCFFELSQKIYQGFGAKNFAIWRDGFVKDTPNLSELLEQGHIDAVVESVEALCRNGNLKKYQNIWWKLIKVHTHGNGYHRYQDLWPAFKKFITYLEDNNLALSEDIIDDLCSKYLAGCGNNKPAFHLVIFLGRMQAVLEKLGKFPVDGNERQQDILDGLDNDAEMDWTQSGIYYAMINNGFCHWYCELELYDLENNRDERKNPSINTYTSDMKQSYAIAANGNKATMSVAPYLRFIAKKFYISVAEYDRYREIIGYISASKSYSFKARDLTARTLLACMTLGIDSISHVDITRFNNTVVADLLKCIDKNKARQDILEDILCCLDLDSQKRNICHLAFKDVPSFINDIEQSNSQAYLSSLQGQDRVAFINYHCRLQRILKNKFFDKYKGLNKQQILCEHLKICCSEEIGHSPIMVITGWMYLVSKFENRNKIKIDTDHEIKMLLKEYQNAKILYPAVVDELIAQLSSIDSANSTVKIDTDHEIKMLLKEYQNAKILYPAVVDELIAQLSSIDFANSTELPTCEGLVWVLCYIAQATNKQSANQWRVRYIKYWTTGHPCVNEQEQKVDEKCVFLRQDGQLRTLTNNEKDIVKQHFQNNLQRIFFLNNKGSIDKLVDFLAVGKELTERQIARQLNTFNSVLLAIDNKSYFNDLGRVLGILLKVCCPSGPDDNNHYLSLDQLTTLLTSLANNKVDGDDRHYPFALLEKWLRHHRENHRSSLLSQRIHYLKTYSKLSAKDRMNYTFLTLLKQSLLSISLKEKIENLALNSEKSSFKNAILSNCVVWHKNFINKNSTSEIDSCQQFLDVSLDLLEKLLPSEVEKALRLYSMLYNTVNQVPSCSLHTLAGWLQLILDAQDSGSMLDRVYSLFAGNSSDITKKQCLIFLMQVVEGDLSHLKNEEKLQVQQNFIAELENTSDDSIVKLLQKLPEDQFLKLAEYYETLPRPGFNFLYKELQEKLPKGDNSNELKVECDIVSSIIREFECNRGKRDYSVTNDDHKQMFRLIQAIKKKGQGFFNATDQKQLVQLLYYSNSYSQQSDFQNLSTAKLQRTIKALAARIRNEEIKCDNNDNNDNSVDKFAYEKVKLLAAIREMVLRQTGMWFNHTQMIALIYAATNHDESGNIVQMKTGEGKSLYTCGRVSYLALMGYTVDVFSSKVSLSKRDHDEFSHVFTSMGIDSSYIAENSKLSDYKNESLGGAIGAVNYSTKGNLSLFRLKQHWQGKNLQNIGREKVAYVDEADTVLDDDTQFNLPDKGGQVYNYNAWVYRVVLDFYRKYKNKIVQKGQISQNEDLSLLLKQLKKKKLTQPEQSDFMDKYFSDKNNQQQGFVKLKDLLMAAHSAMSFKKGCEFSVVWENKTLKEDTTIRVRFAKVLIDNQIQGGASYSNTVQQFLHMRLNDEAIERNEPPYFFIEPESDIALSYNTWRLLKDYHSVEGCTGTGGDVEDRDNLKQWFGINCVVKLPSHRPPIREREPTVFCDAFQQQVIEISNNIIANKNRPILVSCKDDREVRKFYEAVKDCLRNLDCFKSLALIEDLNANGKSEDDILKVAGKNGAVLFSSRVGRGSNIKPKNKIKGLHVIRSYLTEKRRTKQERGRTARYGAPGSTIDILNYEEIEQVYNKLYLEHIDAMNDYYEFERQHLDKKYKKNNKKWRWTMQSNEVQDKYLKSRVVVAMQSQIDKNKNMFKRRKDDVLASYTWAYIETLPTLVSNQRQFKYLNDKMIEFRKEFILAWNNRFIGKEAKTAKDNEKIWSKFQLTIVNKWQDIVNDVKAKNIKLKCPNVNQLHRYSGGGVQNNPKNNKALNDNNQKETIVLAPLIRLWRRWNFLVKKYYWSNSGQVELATTFCNNVKDITELYQNIEQYGLLLSPEKFRNFCEILLHRDDRRDNSKLAMMLIPVKPLKAIIGEAADALSCEQLSENNKDLIYSIVNNLISHKLFADEHLHLSKNLLEQFSVITDISRHIIKYLSPGSSMMELAEKLETLWQHLMNAIYNNWPLSVKQLRALEKLTLNSNIMAKIVLQMNDVDIKRIIFLISRTEDSQIEQRMDYIIQSLQENIEFPAVMFNIFATGLKSIRLDDSNNGHSMSDSEINYDNNDNDVDDLNNDDSESDLELKIDNNNDNDIDQGNDDNNLQITSIFNRTNCFVSCGNKYEQIHSNWARESIWKLLASRQCTFSQIESLRSQLVLDDNNLGLTQACNFKSKISLIELISKLPEYITVDYIIMTLKSCGLNKIDEKIRKITTLEKAVAHLETFLKVISSSLLDTDCYRKYGYFGSNKDSNKNLSKLFLLFKDYGAKVEHLEEFFRALNETKCYNIPIGIIYTIGKKWIGSEYGLVRIENYTQLKTILSKVNCAHNKNLSSYFDQRNFVAVNRLNKGGKATQLRKQALWAMEHGLYQGCHKKNKKEQIYTQYSDSILAAMQTQLLELEASPATQKIQMQQTLNIVGTVLEEINFAVVNNNNVEQKDNNDNDDEQQDGNDRNNKRSIQTRIIGYVTDYQQRNSFLHRGIWRAPERTSQAENLINTLTNIRIDDDNYYEKILEAIMITQAEIKASDIEKNRSNSGYSRLYSITQCMYTEVLRQWMRACVKSGASASKINALIKVLSKNVEDNCRKLVYHLNNESHLPTGLNNLKVKLSGLDANDTLSISTTVSKTDRENIPKKWHSSIESIASFAEFYQNFSDLNSDDNLYAP